MALRIDSYFWRTVVVADVVTTSVDDKEPDKEVDEHEEEEEVEVDAGVRIDDTKDDVNEVDLTPCKPLSWTRHSISRQVRDTLMSSTSQKRDMLCINAMR